MLRAVTSDMMARNLPSVLVGDFNAEVEATPFLQTLLGDPWQDLSGLQSGGPTFTCHKGSGSRIDHIWCSVNCLPIILTFETHSNPFTDRGHDILEVGILINKRAVPRLTPRQSFNFDHLRASNQVFHMDMPREFFTALEQRDVEQAAALW